MRIDELLDIAPANSRLDADPALEREEREHPVHPAHVEMQAPRARGLAAHAEVTATHRDRTGRAEDRIADFVD